VEKELTEAKRKFGDRLIYLDRNENRFGCSPLVTKIIRNSLTEKFLSKYPDPDAQTLKAKIANRTGLSESNVIIGNGSIEVQQMVFRAFTNPGDAVLILDPSYKMFETLASTHGCNIIKVKLGRSFELNVDDLIEKAKAFSCKMLMLCNPNNPTGNLFSQKHIQRIVTNLKKCIILIDETYAEYAEKTSLPLIRSYDNVLITRTFSKAYGLAGLRVGYGIADRHLIEILNRVRIPCCVNAIAQLAAEVALDDFEHLKRVLTVTRIERDRIIRQMEKIREIKPFPSQTNFVLVRVNRPHKVKDLWKYLLSHGIVVRTFENSMLKDYFRVSVGTPSENSKFLKALSSFFKFSSCG
jgi:histidinol-phosphate aminotransferase